VDSSSCQTSPLFRITSDQEFRTFLNKVLNVTIGKANSQRRTQIGLMIMIRTYHNNHDHLRSQFAFQHKAIMNFRLLTIFLLILAKTTISQAQTVEAVYFNNDDLPYKIEKKYVGDNTVKYVIHTE
jgi:hypothetical protein